MQMWKSFDWNSERDQWAAVNQEVEEDMRSGLYRNHGERHKPVCVRQCSWWMTEHSVFYGLCVYLTYTEEGFSLCWSYMGMLLSLGSYDAVSCPRSYFDDLYWLFLNGLHFVAKVRTTFSVPVMARSPWGNLKGDENWSGYRILGFMVVGHQRNTGVWPAATVNVFGESRTVSPSSGSSFLCLHQMIW